MLWLIPAVAINPAQGRQGSHSGMSRGSMAKNSA
jgi:hypothetical protein